MGNDNFDNTDNVYIHRIGKRWVVFFVALAILGVMLLYEGPLRQGCNITVTSQENIIGIDYIPGEKETRTTYARVGDTFYRNWACNVNVKLQSVSDDGIGILIIYADGSKETHDIKYGETGEYFASDMKYEPDNGCDVVFSIMPMK